MLDDIRPSLRPALTLTALFALLLGLVYPLIVLAAGQLLFPGQANGSLLRDADGRVIGSFLIGQTFASPAYFHGRPSAAGTGYDALASAGSNLGPASKALADRIGGVIAADRTSPGSLPPADLVTTSASGLDPDISPEAALYQVPRIAAARHAAPARLRRLVERATDRPALGFLGEARVNVLMLNRTLDRELARP